MTRFEEFIQQDTERLAQKAATSFQQANAKLSSLQITLISLRSSYEELVLHDRTLAQKSLRFMAAARLRRFKLRKAMERSEEATLFPMTDTPAGELEALKRKIHKRADELERSATQAERQKLETELVELIDRDLAADLLPTIRAEIERMRDIHTIDEALTDTSTNAVTNLGNHIADTIVTPRLRDRFQEEIVSLAAGKVRVEIVRAGGSYGSPQYQIRLFANPDAKWERS